MKQIKCVVVGDSVCDIPRFLYKSTIYPYPKKETKLFFEEYSRHIDYEDKVINLQLTHTSTEGNDENLLPLSSPQIDVIIAKMISAHICKIFIKFQIPFIGLGIFGLL